MLHLLNAAEYCDFSDRHFLKYYNGYILAFLWIRFFSKFNWISKGRLASHEPFLKRCPFTKLAGLKLPTLRCMHCCFSANVADWSICCTLWHDVVRQRNSSNFSNHIQLSKFYDQCVIWNTVYHPASKARHPWDLAATRLWGEVGYIFLCPFRKNFPGDRKGFKGLTWLEWLGLRLDWNWESHHHHYILCWLSLIRWLWFVARMVVFHPTVGGKSSLQTINFGVSREITKGTIISGRRSSSCSDIPLQ